MIRRKFGGESGIALRTNELQAVYRPDLGRGRQPKELMLVLPRNALDS